MDLDYREVGTDKSWRLDVHYNGAAIGTIRKSADGLRHEYYHGVGNDFAYAYSKTDLDDLKRLLAVRLSRTELIASGLMI